MWKEYKLDQCLKVSFLGGIFHDFLPHVFEVKALKMT